MTLRTVILWVAKANMMIELQIHAAIHAAMKQIMKYDFDHDIFKSAASRPAHNRTGYHGGRLHCHPERRP
jgi:hypothetical protein